MRALNIIRSATVSGAAGWAFELMQICEKHVGHLPHPVCNWPQQQMPKLEEDKPQCHDGKSYARDFKAILACPLVLPVATRVLCQVCRSCMSSGTCTQFQAIRVDASKALKTGDAETYTADTWFCSKAHLASRSPVSPYKKHRSRLESVLGPPISQNLHLAPGRFFFSECRRLPRVPPCGSRWKRLDMAGLAWRPGLALAWPCLGSARAILLCWGNARAKVPHRAPRSELLASRLCRTELILMPSSSRASNPA